MSQRTIDTWLGCLSFQSYRLTFMPDKYHSGLLLATIQAFESMPVTEENIDRLEIRLGQLEDLKEDLASVQQLVSLAEKVAKIRDQMRDKGFLHFDGDEAEEALYGISDWFEKRRIEQRQQQRMDLRMFRHFWPKADTRRKRRMVAVFATYGRRRLMWGAVRLRVATPTKIAMWATRMYRRLK